MNPTENTQNQNHSNSNNSSQARIPTLLQSLIPIVVLLLLIMLNVFYTEGDSLGGANQLSLVLAAFVAGGIAIFNRVGWERINDSIVHIFSSAVPAILILLMVGVLSGAWMISGIIPTMIYYGLEVLRPEYFFVATIIITSIISVATGSSWSTIATIGVALISIGEALNFNPAWTAGAIISGAYFGDKVSPLSETTNLAATVANVDVFAHIRYMMRTTVPSIVITLVVFAVLTFFSDATQSYDLKAVQNFQHVISDTYTISIWFLLIPVVVVLLIVKKMPAIPVLLIGSLLAIFTAAFFQEGYMQLLNGGETLTLFDRYDILTRAMYGATVPQTSSAEVNDLLSTGGMAGMTNTVWLIITAMIFGGVMEAGHFLEKITYTILKKVNSRASMVTATTTTCIMFNMTTGDQYMSIIIPGKMFVGAYAKQDFNPLLLSRTLEDAATATSPLVPWNTCGATQATILGVATVAYLPFAVFCYMSPIMTLLFAWGKRALK